MNFVKDQIVLVRDNDDECWEKATFIEKTSFHFYEVSKKELYNQCIPFDGNKHLHGSTQSPYPEDAESFGFGSRVYFYTEETDDWRRGIITKVNENKDGSYTFSILTKEGQNFITSNLNYIRHVTPSKEA